MSETRHDRGGASRREFLQRTAGLGIALGALRLPALGRPLSPREALGPLQEDPAKLFDLPLGFEYRVISRVGETMDDGRPVPARHDGMAAFALADGRTALVRNHENALGEGSGAFAEGEAFDPAHGEATCLGGTTTLVYDTEAQELGGHWMSLAGTLVNCAGGATPWGTWISCEETVARKGEVLERDHGWCFEVPADGEGLVEPVPLVGLGRFRHEAVTVDPLSGCLYLTEDVADGLFYRFVPSRPGDLLAGGKLQALRVSDAPSLDTRNWSQIFRIPVGMALDVDWVDMEQIDSPLDDLRSRGFVLGAARFARSEGVHYGSGSVWFTCTSGGAAKLGQIWRYQPSRFEGTEKESSSLTLFLEPEEASIAQNVDNIFATSFGHLLVCEDGAGSDRLLGVTPAATVYELGRNAAGSGELAGAVFSPDGSTLFVNLQLQGVTLAITGPWERAAAIE